jgi:mannose-6-phosphate isomerase-like protein (cupin superfamily)
MNHMQLQPLASAGAGTAEVLLSGPQFRSAWHQFLRIILEPGASHCPEAVGRSEIGYISLAGNVTFQNDEFAVAVESPAVLKCPASSEYRIVNDGESLADLLFVSVNLSAQQEGSAKPSFDIEAVDAAMLRGWHAAIHGGCGQIATRHIWSPADFASSWTFLDHAVLASRSSVGYHHHGGLEEAFVILSGSGLMTIEGETFEVEPGSVTFQGIEQAHGIYNPGDESLAFLRIAIGVPGEEFTTIDLDDDLASRRSPGST